MIFGEQYFGAINLLTGTLLAVLGGMMLLNPTRLARGLAAFPRHRIVGMALTAIALIWSALFIDHMSLGGLNEYKWLLYILTPLSFYLIIHYLDDLLAARALGGILMLYPTAMVDSARWMASPSRYVLIVTGYVFVILGIWLMLSPFKFRQWSNGLMANRTTSLVFGIIVSAVALAMLFIGLFIG